MIAVVGKDHVLGWSSARTTDIWQNSWPRQVWVVPRPGPAEQVEDELLGEADQVAEGVQAFGDQGDQGFTVGFLLEWLEGGSPCLS